MSLSKLLKEAYSRGKNTHPKKCPQIRTGKTMEK